ncbi:MAG: class I SAM-dependent methyltransferase [Promethearchaeota archaeon]
MESTIDITHDKIKTGFKSVVYRSGLIYNFVNQRAYDFWRKFKTIAAIACSNGNKTILDLPCGTAYLTRYLKSDVTYIGWDLNKNFLAKIKHDWKKGRIRLKKVILQQKNIFDFHDYPKNVDVIVFCDILHHIYPQHVKLVENAKDYAKKIIICEPVAVKPKNMNVKDWTARMTINVVKRLPEAIFRYIDFLFADNDGINTYLDRSNWIYDRNSLREFYITIGIKRNKIYDIGDEMIGVWENS